MKSTRACTHTNCQRQLCACAASKLRKKILFLSHKTGWWNNIISVLRPKWMQTKEHTILINIREHTGFMAMPRENHSHTHTNQPFHTRPPAKVFHNRVWERAPSIGRHCTILCKEKDFYFVSEILLKNFRKVVSTDWFSNPKNVNPKSIWIDCNCSV